MPGYLHEPSKIAQRSSKARASKPGGDTNEICYRLKYLGFDAANASSFFRRSHQRLEAHLVRLDEWHLGERRSENTD
jgi:hypothetical protein